MATRLTQILSARRVAYATFALAAFLGAVGALAAMTEPLRPPPGVDELSGKVAYFDAHRDELDILVIGSSRVYRAIDPAIVERTLAGRGCPGKRVYNFGLSGMSAPLMTRLVDYIELNATRPYLVLFEPELPIGPEYEVTVTDRARFSNQWHTILPGVLQLATFVDGGWRSMQETGLLYVKYAASFLRTGIGVGRLRDLLLPQQAGAEPQAGPLWHQAGFYALDQELRDVSGAEKERLLRRHQDVLSADRLPILLERFARVGRDLKKPPRATAAQRAYVDYLVARTAIPQITPAFLFMPINEPTIAARQEAMAAYLKRAHPRVTTINAGLSYLPELMEPRLWFDHGHLTADGAAILSQRIGEQLCGGILSRL